MHSYCRHLKPSSFFFFFWGKLFLNHILKTSEVEFASKENVFFCLFYLCLLFLFCFVQLFIVHCNYFLFCNLHIENNQTIKSPVYTSWNCFYFTVNATHLHCVQPSPLYLNAMHSCLCWLICSCTETLRCIGHFLKSLLTVLSLQWI